MEHSWFHLRSKMKSKYITYLLFLYICIYIYMVYSLFPFIHRLENFGYRCSFAYIRDFKLFLVFNKIEFHLGWHFDKNKKINIYDWFLYHCLLIDVIQVFMGCFSFKFEQKTYSCFHNYWDFNYDRSIKLY